MVKLYVGITDGDWFTHLSARPNLGELNFWAPSGGRRFRVLQPGELFLFKLHSPNDFIVGGGVFAYENLLPTSLAWAAFGEGNGAPTLDIMRRRIGFYRGEPYDPRTDPTIGCRILE